MSEFKALRHLSENKNIVFRKVNKGNTIVILDKISYISAIEEILNDKTKISNIDILTDYVYFFKIMRSNGNVYTLCHIV